MASGQQNDDGTQSLGTVESIMREQEDDTGLEPPLRHALGVCVVSFVVMFQLGVIALDLGYDMLGYEVASIAALAIFVFMASWRAYDLLIGKITDMGILFMAYQNGNEMISRISVRILAVLAVIESLACDLPVFAGIVAIVALALPWADSVAVSTSHCVYEKQTLDRQNNIE